MKKNLQIKILSVLTSDLIKTKYKNKSKHYGYCYIVSEAAYHLYAKEKGFSPYVAKDCYGLTHWWLQNNKNEIIDIVAHAYYDDGEEPPYKNGRKTAFLTKQPSKRCKIILERIKNV